MTLLIIIITHHGVKLCVEVEAIRSHEGRIRSSCACVWIEAGQSWHDLHAEVGPPVLDGKAV